MTRIVMTADAVGGVWTYATDLARGLCARGHEVTLVTMGPAPRPAQLAPLSGVEGLEIEITDLALEWMDPEGADQRAHDVLLAIAQGVRPDVVHLNGYREAALPWPAPVLVVAHSCVWTWWEACRGTPPDDPRWHRYAGAVRTGLRAANAWAAPTAAIRDAVAQHYQPATQGRVIRNGIDLAACVPADNPVILAAGRLWDEAKNLRALGAIAAGLDWPVRVAGPTAPEQTARDVIHLGVLERAQMIEEMRQAGIFVSPALYEPFGLSVLEAAACGCALVLSDLASFRELWVGAALFVDPRDPDDLTAALQRLCRDDGLRACMQQAARRRARRYRLETMVDAYEAVYEGLMKRGASLRNAALSRAAGECHA
jgi:glycosyltransferase involved in cell wall biosynthesis